MTELSVWTYPWDLHDFGLDDAVETLTSRGVNTISLATSYHAGKFLQPGNPTRKVYFPEDGTVYYTVDPARWEKAEIKPLQAEIVTSEGDYLAALIERRDAGGPQVSCWTVCLHNSRLGMAHPDHALRTAHGDPLVYGLCPSSPAARAYITGMIAEISNRYRPDRIELESPDFMGFDHGYHHEKDALGLLPEDVFLLGICFCPHCLERAGTHGVNARSAQDTVRRLLDQAFARERPRSQFPQFPKARLEAFADYPDLLAYLKWRSEPVTSLIKEIRAAAHPDCRILLIDDNDSWWRGIDLHAIAPHCDGVIHCAYTTLQDNIAPDLGRVRAAIGADKSLIAGFMLSYPQVEGSSDLSARTAAALKVADGCNYYNFGLVPHARLRWLDYHGEAKVKHG
jgi:hypothetical protein